MPRSPRSSRLLASFALAAAAGATLPGALACNRCDLYYLPIEWHAEEVPVDADLFAVAAAKGVVVAVGEGGAIARQAGEAAWTAPASATDAALRGVEFATPEVVIAVGDGGVVVRSVDAGETWAAVDAGVEDDLAAVGCDDAGTCVAAGDGVLLVSTDAGATWAPPASAPAELGALRAVGVNTGFDEFVAVGLAGAVVISPDGQTWTAVPGASADFHAVALTASDWALGGADGPCSSWRTACSSTSRSSIGRPSPASPARARGWCAPTGSSCTGTRPGWTSPCARRRSCHPFTRSSQSATRWSWSATAAPSVACGWPRSGSATGVISNHVCKDMSERTRL
ncbi:WD40/YVTN/BNR-like repeat-containing protein [Nannocystis pusilla]|uniref:WD40/YVTN/BNR-like repeat-containing protein n=1 Tax=Nannocystis pusilla TaxID=889268 RepID=UPI003B7B2AE7